MEITCKEALKESSTHKDASSCIIHKGHTCARSKQHGISEQHPWVSAPATPAPHRGLQPLSGSLHCPDRRIQAAAASTPLPMQHSALAASPVQSPISPCLPAVGMLTPRPAEAWSIQTLLHTCSSCVTMCTHVVLCKNIIDEQHTAI
jgi:hypothetical protein